MAERETDLNGTCIPERYQVTPAEQAQGALSGDALTRWFEGLMAELKAGK